MRTATEAGEDSPNDAIRQEPGGNLENRSGAFDAARCSCWLTQLAAAFPAPGPVTADNFGEYR